MSQWGVTKKNPNLFLSIVSFLIPMVGFIIGVFFIIKPGPADKSTGKRCLGWALAGSIFGSIIFGNLIANAINYSPKGAMIIVKAGLAGKFIQVQVIDNGFGIAPKYHDQIFERFYRVKDDNTRYITGTGLGLPIVKGLVDSLKGNISLDSDVGKGTTFTVLLPV